MSERRDEIVEASDGHDFQRTIPTDGRWCQRCGLSESEWGGDRCAGEITAAVFERKIIERTSGLLEQLDVLTGAAELLRDAPRYAFHASVCPRFAPDVIPSDRCTCGATDWLPRVVGFLAALAPRGESEPNE